MPTCWREGWLQIRRQQKSVGFFKYFIFGYSAVFSNVAFLLGRPFTCHPCVKGIMLTLIQELFNLSILSSNPRSLSSSCCSRPVNLSSSCCSKLASLLVISCGKLASCLVLSSHSSSAKADHKISSRQSALESNCFQAFDTFHLCYGSGVRHIERFLCFVIFLSF